VSAQLDSKKATSLLRTLALGLALLAASAALANTAKPRAAPGALLVPAERALHVVVGELAAPRALDGEGWSADLVIERALVGGAQRGAKLRVAWEELAPSRSVRFAAGERVLLALETLPNGSLWMARFPKRDALAISGRGDAFARAPSAATVAALARFLALTRAQREHGAGVEALVEIALRAEFALARQALVRLAGIAGLAAKLGEPGRASLAALLASSERGVPLRAGALALIAQRKLVALSPEVRALVASGGALAAPAVEALGALGALSAEDARAHAASPDAKLRAAALRGASSALDASRLAALARGDRDANVRAAALAALVRREGPRAADAAVEALFDSDDVVQAAALRALPAFPAEASRLLRARAFGSRADDADAHKLALAGLAQLGREGAAVLEEIARDHPREETRELATFLLGRTQPH
jgi:hypothetical protein